MKSYMNEVEIPACTTQGTAGDRVLYIYDQASATKTT